MRILYHHRTLADGAEGIHIAEMVAAFRALGHEVHVCGLSATGGADGGRQLASRLKRALPGAAFEAASIASNAPDYLGVRRAIRETRPDFLYKRHARLDVAAIAAARRAGIPTVLEVNCLFSGTAYRRYEPMAFDRVAAQLERRVIRMADVVLAVSTPLAASIERACSVRAAVMPNGADPERFDPKRIDRERVRARLGLGDGITVGWAGVMREWHGLELLIDVLAAMPDARLLIVGDGPARKAIEQHAASRGMSSRLTITGRVPAERMPEHIAAMDVAVVAGDGTGIASPMKLLEYMAMERPVVAPRLENIRDLVTDGHDGLLFAAGDQTDLAAQLRRLTADSALRRELGEHARRTIVLTRNWRSNAERVTALVDTHRADSHRRLGSQQVAVNPAENRHV